MSRELDLEAATEHLKDIARRYPQDAVSAEVFEAAIHFARLCAPVAASPGVDAHWLMTVCNQALLKARADGAAHWRDGLQVIATKAAEAASGVEAGDHAQAPSVREALKRIVADAGHITRRTNGDPLMLANRILDAAESALVSIPQRADTAPAAGLREIWIGYSDRRFKPIPFLTAADGHEWMRSVNPNNFGKCHLFHYRQVLPDAGKRSGTQLFTEARNLLEFNGGPIDGDDGIEYVMVRRQDFEAMELAYKTTPAAPPRKDDKP